MLRFQSPDDIDTDTEIEYEDDYEIESRSKCKYNSVQLPYVPHSCSTAADSVYMMPGVSPLWSIFSAVCINVARVAKHSVMYSE